MNRAKTWIQHPAYVESEWLTRNPLLLAGEVAIVKDVDTGRAMRMKIGPGYFNDLPYFDDIYDFADAPTNPIGDASGDLSGLTIPEILNKMLNPYQAPAISNVTNNAGGSNANIWTLEIGISVPGPILVNYNVSNQLNLLGATPINIEANGVFQNEGDKAIGPISLNLAAALNPTLVNTVTIKLKANHQKGVSSIVTTIVKHVPKIIWGISPSATLIPGDWNSLTLRKTKITDNFEQDFDFGSVGYAHLALPTMLAPANLKFTEVTDPNSIWNYSVVDLGVQSINNGLTTYTYQHYRSEFYLNVPTIMRVRK